MILDLDDQGWAHISTALKNHIQWCRDNRIDVPPDVRALHRAATSKPNAKFPAHVDLLVATYADAAERLGVSKRTIERMVKDGTLQCVRIGTSPRIRIADLNALVKPPTRLHPMYGAAAQYHPTYRSAARYRTSA